jgi:AraC family transcriptional regulator
MAHPVAVTTPRARKTTTPRDSRLESGFATPETFTRAFVQRFEISPSVYRRMLRAYREHADLAQQSTTFAGFAEETPLTLRYDLDAVPVRGSSDIRWG